MITPGNNPPFYFPPVKGKYEVKPGLASLTTDFGNGNFDRHVFQLDNQFHRYRNNKITARNESLEKYICLNNGRDLSPVTDFIIKTLVREHPDYFLYDVEKNQLDCTLTNEILAFNQNHQLDNNKSYYQNKIPYINAFDALAMQVQEDMAIMEIDNTGQGNIIALHLCAPNHWAAQDKIGKDFVMTHQPVPGIERINHRANEINLACLNKGPFVRFAWGLSTDHFLNHHPRAPAGIEPPQWSGRKFDPESPVLFMRTERQTIQGFQAEGLLLFTIRTYFYAVDELAREYQKALLNALHSMTEATLQYKGLAESKDAICDWLAQNISA